MLYPVLTVIVGLAMILISVLSLVNAIRDGGIFLNQIRFIFSGVLLVLHFPLTHLMDGYLRPLLEEAVDIEGAATASYWTAVIVLVAAQLVILPTRRDLYGVYLADRVTRRAA